MKRTTPGFIDFTSLGTELTLDELFTVNGGYCGGDTSGGSCSGGKSGGSSTTSTTPGKGNSSGSASNASTGGNNGTSTKGTTGNNTGENDSSANRNTNNSDKTSTSEITYYDDYGNITSDQYAITGKNMGEMEISEINIVIEYSDKKNQSGAIIGTMYAYYVDKFRRAKNPAGYLQASYPIVSGSNDFEPAPKGIWKDVKQEKTSTSSNPKLKDAEHGSDSNIMIRLWGTGGDAIHQGNNTVSVEDAFTEGCIGVTSYNLNYNSDNYYGHFKKVINPYGETIGVQLNVEIK